MTRLEKKGWIISLLLAIVLVYMAMPLYMPVSTKLNLTNDKAQIAVYNDGFQNNSVKLLSKVDNSVFGECKKNGTACAGYSITENITNKWEKYKIKFEVVGDGVVYIDFRGVQITDNNEIKHAMPVDYRNFTVNGELVFEDTKTHSHDKTFQYSMSVKNGDIVMIDVEIKNHLPELSQVQKLIFLSILILSFLLSYKLVQYVAKFKILENNSRIDIIFVAVFALLLFVPMSHISNAEKSLQENRMLAKYPQFVLKDGINDAFGEQFNSWFNDRFLGRNIALKTYSEIHKLNNIISNKIAVFDKKTHWAFITAQFKRRIDNDISSKILNTYEQLNDFMTANNIKLYFLIVPEKMHIYGEHNILYKKFANHLNDLNISANYISSKASFPVIFPYNEIKAAANKDYVYFKTEHHWTEWGAYIGYQELMKAIKKDFPSLKVVTENDYDIFYNNKVKGDWDETFGLGEEFALMNISLPEETFLDAKYKYYKPKADIKRDITDAPNYKIKHFQNANDKSGIRAILTGTSMNENLLKFLPYSFAELKYFRLISAKNVEFIETFKLLKRYKNDILSFKPDVLIVCLTASDLPNSILLTKE